VAGPARANGRGAGEAPRRGAAAGPARRHWRRSRSVLLRKSALRRSPPPTEPTSPLAGSLPNPTRRRPGAPHPRSRPTWDGEPEKRAVTGKCAASVRVRARSPAAPCGARPPRCPLRGRTPLRLWARGARSILILAARSSLSAGQKGGGPGGESGRAAGGQGREFSGRTGRAEGEAVSRKRGSPARPAVRPPSPLPPTAMKASLVMPGEGGPEEEDLRWRVSCRAGG
jgi:hypothetical protein